ncbi:hypothetical protein JCM16358_07710 [Halanaerocella petrolearia]
MESIQSTTQSNQTSSAYKQNNLDQAGLGKEDFLKLLVTQLKNQNPMKPMKDKEFMGQMAQFNSLEQMQSLNNTMSNFVKYQQLSQTSSLIGKKVEVLDNKTGATATGKVEKIDMSSSNPQVVVNGGKYPVVNIQEVVATE